MSLILGDTGKSQVGPLKTYAITQATPRETLLGSALTLPTTEPTTGQISYTIQDTDLPTITGNIPMKYNASIICSGKIGATAAILNYRVLKNGANVVQTAGASATATQFWTHTHWRAFDVQVGDVIEIKYWANQTDVTLDFYGLMIYPTQLFFKTNIIMKDLNLPLVNQANFATTFTTSSSQAIRLFPSTAAVGIDLSTTAVFPALCISGNTGLYRQLNGELTVKTDQNVSATQRQMTKNLFPSPISFREVLR